MPLRSWPEDGRFGQLRSVLPGVLYDELRERHSADPEAFIAGWGQLAQDMRQGFIQHARRAPDFTDTAAADRPGAADTRHGRRSSAPSTRRKTSFFGRRLPWNCWR